MEHKGMLMIIKQSDAADGNLNKTVHTASPLAALCMWVQTPWAPRRQAGNYRGASCRQGGEREREREDDWAERANKLPSASQQLELS